MMNRLKNACRACGSQTGQDMIEYALIMGLVSVVAIAAIISLGGTIESFWDTLSNSIPSL